jgi:transcriptional regulator with PAS, ATPase and Fis domain
MESELFGHAKGAYTGAFSAKKGLIEAADGGTAFFDEIGELPLEVQSKLLRLLQEKEFRPVGSLQWRRSDFRVISATNRDLAKEVERGTFRRDLYYRLNVVQIKVQPLRERRTDIPLLVDHFLHIYGRGHHVSEEVMNAFLSYDWPGNVRELENTIQHMVAIGDGPIFTIVDVPDEILHFMKARQTTTSVEARDSVDGSTIGSSASSAPAPPFTPAKTERVPMMTLSDLEKIAISQALEYTRGDTSVAASLLGIGRATLYRKIKEYGLAS